jgi:hypothetical protein
MFKERDNHEKSGKVKLPAESLARGNIFTTASRFKFPYMWGNFSIFPSRFS